MNQNDQDTAPAEENPPAGAGGEVEALKAEIAALSVKLKEAEDNHLRARAETENARRRAEIDVANAHKYSIERFAGEVIAVKDSLELAKAVDLQADDQGAVAKMFEGLDLTLKLINSVFDKFGISEISPQPGAKFDPEQHQAMSMVESADVAPNHVVTLVQKGYSLNERLLRPAMVMVAKAAN